MYLCVHFGQFLNGRIDTEEKERAYNKIVDYLDEIQEIEFPKNWKNFCSRVLDRWKKQICRELIHL